MSGQNTYGFYPMAQQVEFVPDQLIAGNLKLVTRDVTIGENQTLPRGAVVGQVTASGQFILSVATATDGSQNPLGIIVDTVTTGASATGAGSIYEMGEFNSNYLTYDPSWNVTSLTNAFRNVSIFIKTSISSNIV